MPELIEGTGFLFRRFDESAPSKEEREQFDCGTDGLNRWFLEHARRSMDSRDAVTHVLFEEGAPRRTVAGYFCVSAGSVSRAEATRVVSRGAPDPVPVILIGRLAVDRRYQGRGLGAQILQEALRSAASASRLIGARAVLVDVIDEAARSFYTRFGFEVSPISELKYMLPMADILAALGDQG